MPKTPQRPPFSEPEPAGVGAYAADVLRRRPIDTLAGLVAVAGVTTILVNALLLQEGRHPAPWFRDGVGRAEPKPAAAAPAPQRSELVAQVQDALAARGLYDGPVDGLPGVKTTAAILAFEQSAKLPSTGHASDRVLAALIVTPQPSMQPSRSLQPTPPAKASPATTGSISGPKLMAVQRALGRLGYGPVAVDGKMGAATRNALLSFERDRKLPQTGEPGAQVLRELQAVSGAPLE